METLLNNLIQATGWSILHSLWQGALIYALLLPSQMKVFRLSAKLKYMLAYTANCLLFICFIFTFLSVFHWPTDLDHNTVPHLISFKTVLPTTLSQYAERLFPTLVLLYTLGLFVQSFIVIKGYTKVRALKKASYTEIPAAWKILFQQLTRNLHVKRQIDFRLSNQVTVPLVIGFLKPVILFPIALAAQMDIKHIEAILIHELSHIRRNDYVFNLIRTMINTVLFFNPFIWLTGKLIEIEREHACDDLVVKITDTPLTYAHALLQLELLKDKSSPILSLAATGTEQHLYQRIKRITDMKTNYMNSKQKLLTVSLTIATIVSLAWINPSKSEKSITKIVIPPVTTIHLSAVNPLDTGKKKVKKQVKTLNKIYISQPGIPPLPPNAIGNPPAPEPPEPIEVPEPPAVPEIQINLDANAISGLTSAVSNFSINVKDIVTAGDVNQIQLEQMSKELEKSSSHFQNTINTPEQKAKWQKYAQEMQTRYNTPEQKAKWQKYAQEMQAKYNSREQRAKWEKMAKEAQKTANLNSQKWNDIKFNYTVPEITFTENSAESVDKQKIKQSPEYIELKKKFDKDVEELANKKLKKDNN